MQEEECFLEFEALAVGQRPGEERYAMQIVGAHLRGVVDAAHIRFGAGVDQRIIVAEIEQRRVEAGERGR